MRSLHPCGLQSLTSLLMNTWAARSGDLRLVFSQRLGTSARSGLKLNNPSRSVPRNYAKKSNMIFLLTTFELLTLPLLLT